MERRYSDTQIVIDTTPSSLKISMIKITVKHLNRISNYLNECVKLLPIVVECRYSIAYVDAL